MTFLQTLSSNPKRINESQCTQTEPQFEIKHFDRITKMHELMSIYLIKQKHLKNIIDIDL
jgi:hypothetical protein